MANRRRKRRKTSNKGRWILFATFSLTVSAGVIYGVNRVLDSHVFNLEEVHVELVPAVPQLGTPVDRDKVKGWAQVPLGEETLFEINLAEVEERLLEKPWIKKVELSKEFPKTLRIRAHLRQPVALLQGKKGVSYLDQGGEGFGHLALNRMADLPMLVDVPSERMNQALKWVEAWGGHRVGRFSQLSSLTWDKSLGFRALLLYPLAKTKDVSRTVASFGRDVNIPTVRDLDNLSGVLEWLVKRSQSSREVLMNGGKKIVVKIIPDS